eukprot:GILK01006231.1.p1 GENE.GILK01006231.1~~GILK01006231.1.p1  ORF type:complete len:1456 (+),score=327.18 GILK01006231.1:316-4368(+)
MEQTDFIAEVPEEEENETENNTTANGRRKSRRGSRRGSRRSGSTIIKSPTASSGVVSASDNLLSVPSSIDTSNHLEPASDPTAYTSTSETVLTVTSPSGANRSSVIPQRTPKRSIAVQAELQTDPTRELTVSSDVQITTSKRRRRKAKTADSSLVDLIPTAFLNQQKRQQQQQQQAARTAGDESTVTNRSAQLQWVVKDPTQQRVDPLNQQGLDDDDDDSEMEVVRSRRTASEPVKDVCHVSIVRVVLPNKAGYLTLPCEPKCTIKELKTQLLTQGARRGYKLPEQDAINLQLMDNGSVVLEDQTSIAELVLRYPETLQNEMLQLTVAAKQTSAQAQEQTWQDLLQPKSAEEVRFLVQRRKSTGPFTRRVLVLDRRHHRIQLLDCKSRPKDFALDDIQKLVPASDHTYSAPVLTIHIVPDLDIPAFDVQFGCAEDYEQFSNRYAELKTRPSSKGSPSKHQRKVSQSTGQVLRRSIILGAMAESQGQRTGQPLFDMSAPSSHHKQHSARLEKSGSIIAAMQFAGLLAFPEINISDYGQESLAQLNDQVSSSQLAADNDDDMTMDGARDPKPEEEDELDGVEWKSFLDSYFMVTKMTKYGLKQKRMVRVSPRDNSMRLYNLTGKMTKEIVLGQVAELGMRAGDDRRIYLVFAAELKQKPCTLIFSTAAERDEFCRLANSHIGTGDPRPVNSSSNRLSVDETSELLSPKHSERTASTVKHSIVRGHSTIQSQSSSGSSGSTVPWGTLATVSESKPTGPEVERIEIVAKKEDDARFYLKNNMPLKQRNFSWYYNEDLSIEPGMLRFYVMKSSRHSQLRRILVLNLTRGVLMSLSPEEKVRKTIRFSDIWQMQNSYEDNKRLKLVFNTENRQWDVTFSSAMAKERFCSTIRSLLDPNILTSLQDEDRKKEPISIFVSTWNMAKAVAGGLDQFVDVHGYDLYALGFQECRRSYKSEWLAYISQLMDNGNCELVTVVSMWEMFLVVYARRKHLPKITNVQTDTKATGLANYIGNKGGVAVSLRFHETSLCFISSHMAARAERLMDRRMNYQDLIKHLKMGRKELDVATQFDYCFWVGDLNYRIEGEFDSVVEMCNRKDYNSLRALDQLKREMDQKRVFFEFRESPIQFTPTYRWAKDGPTFSKKRGQAPSYCDRVLWKPLPGNNGAQTSYKAHHNVLGSDHRPVSATFTVDSLLPFVRAEGYFGLSHSCVLEMTDLCLRIGWGDFLSHSVVAFPAHLQLGFYSTCLEDYPATTQQTFQSEMQAAEITWSAVDIPYLSPIISDHRYIHTQHLFLILCIAESDTERVPIAQASLSLNSVCDEGGISFIRPLMRNGKDCGTIQGRIKLHHGNHRDIGYSI